MMHFAGAVAPTPVAMPSRLDRFVDANSFDKPTLVIGLNRVSAQFRALKSGLGAAHIHYAVKANPAHQIIARLVDMGCNFDAASKGEVELCLQQGAHPRDISFGNTIKRASDIAWAFQADRFVTLQMCQYPGFPRGMWQDCSALCNNQHAPRGIVARAALKWGKTLTGGQLRRLILLR